MTSRPSPALLQALALFRAPRGARPRPDERLPEGVEQLVRVAAGDAQALAEATRSAGGTSSAVREAAAFYIQQVMFASGSDSYRVLGLGSDATDEQLKAHHRWLTRWLHPDRNRDEWEAIYAERVNRAWNDLRNSERRRQYDLSRAGTAAMSAHSPASKSVVGRAVYLDGAEPGWSLRWLPHAIFGGLGLSALVVVALYYAVSVSNPSSPSDDDSTTTADRIDPSALADARIAKGVHEEAVGTEPRLAATSALRSPVDHPAPELQARTTPGAAQPSASPPINGAKLEPVRLSEQPGKSRVVAPVQEYLPTSPSSVAIRDDHAAVAPAPTPASVPVQERSEMHDPPRSATISQREANRILGRFSEIYADGNLAGMRGMFTADATSPDGGLDSILDEYDQLFEHSKQRLLAVRNVTWSASGDTFSIQADYEATVKAGMLRKQYSRGKLRLDLVQEGQQWRIFRIEHDERPD